MDHHGVRVAVDHLGVVRVRVRARVRVRDRVRDRDRVRVRVRVRVRARVRFRVTSALLLLAISHACISASRPRDVISCASAWQWKREPLKPRQPYIELAMILSAW